MVFPFPLIFAGAGRRRTSPKIEYYTNATVLYVYRICQYFFEAGLVVHKIPWKKLPPKAFWPQGSECGLFPFVIQFITTYMPVLRWIDLQWFLKISIPGSVHF